MSPIKLKQKRKQTHYSGPASRRCHLVNDTIKKELINVADNILGKKKRFQLLIILSLLFCD